MRHVSCWLIRIGCIGSSFLHAQPADFRGDSFRRRRRYAN